MNKNKINDITHKLKNFRHITRSHQDRLVFGVCGGLGEHFNIDPLIFRAIFIALTIVFVSGPLIYLFTALIIPPEKF